MNKETEKPEVALDKYVQMVLQEIKPIKVGDLVEGPVIAETNTAIYVDLGPNGTGIIYGLEYINARDLIKKMNIGDVVSAKVIEVEDKNGYIDLSLREAKNALLWDEAEKALKNKDILSLVVKDANKGGLIINWNGVDGFLPSSQLKGDHYPKVAEGEKEQILVELKKLIGERLPVTIISVIPKEGKLIFSETTDELGDQTKKSYTKKEDKEEYKDRVSSKYNVGDKLDGVVTGVVDFGIFVKVNDDIEGLIHKSEIDWGLVEDTKDYAKVGDSMKVEVIEVKDGKISLSHKRLKKNPWEEAASKYKKGDMVNGVVIKFNKHGALVSIEEGVAGLVHMSDFESESAMKAKLSLGKVYKFKITYFDGKEEKMTLALEA